LLELERNCWSWSGVAGVGAGPTRTRKGKKSSSFSCLFACLLQRSKLRSLRCFAATQQAPEPGFGACVALLQRSKLRSQASELALLCCNAASSGARLRSLRCFLATQQAPEPSLLACCGLLAAATQQAREHESLLLQHSKLRSLLQLNPTMQQALERLLQ
jgi:hypothetical protein